MIILNTFSRTIQKISTEAARFLDLTWLTRIGKQRMQAMVASTGSRVADAGLEKKVASPVFGMFAAMFSWRDALFRMVRNFWRSSSVPLPLSVQYETQEGLGLDGSEFEIADAAEE